MAGAEKGGCIVHHRETIEDVRRAEAVARLRDIEMRREVVQSELAALDVERRDALVEARAAGLSWRELGELVGKHFTTVEAIVKTELARRSRDSAKERRDPPAIWPGVSRVFQGS